jgi:hypothetical protein
MFSSVRTFCLVVGHTKSGSSMLGALLDAHPRIIMADELDALKYLAAGFDAERLYHLIDKSAHREALKGRVTARRLSAYSFEVPGQWQGRHDSVEVVGDAKAGIATQRLGNDPTALANLRRIIGTASLKLAHVVRNPFDPIAVMTIRGGRTFEDAIDRYFTNSDILTSLHEGLDPELIEIVRYEDMVAQPRVVLANMCRFLGVDYTDEYIEACAAVVRSEPERERTQVKWDGPVLAEIETRASRYPFLSGYSFDS